MFKNYRTASGSAQIKKTEGKPNKPLNPTLVQQ
uniref:Uncharacterized protein n=1 Tax=Anguilla anguilla TaxID=7936 RepID=A0A0E9VTJ8_ANGAN